ncbi:hypothetical protein [Pseudanabaena sp. PCC 6802]|uniref:hypothetical protein n=1 Tax=Pseudanabaena sp. PCC 6802 TaxID=118173 RepID=UPI000346BAF8|nr:hypothetical protein [Pseudanabaena sp. PCC 6802]
MNNLPTEKEFAHALFCQQVEAVDLESAKKLLKDLHLLYLGQQALFAQLAKRDFGAIEKAIGDVGI